jgi:hypothetical protein
MRYFLSTIAICAFLTLPLSVSATLMGTDSDFSAGSDPQTITLASRTAGFPNFDFGQLLFDITSATLAGHFEVMGSDPRDADKMGNPGLQALAVTGEVTTSVSSALTGVQGAVVPEPSTAALMALGLAGLSVAGRRRTAS